jgi:hypothetical protein
MQNEILALVKTITRAEIEREQLQDLIRQLQTKVKELGKELELARATKPTATDPEE